MRLLDDSSRAGVWPDSVQVIGGKLFMRLRYDMGREVLGRGVVELWPVAAWLTLLRSGF